MNVLIVNTSEKTGGAAVASNRLLMALNNNGVKAKMMVMHKDTNNISVVELKNKTKQKFNFLFERLCVFLNLHFSKKNLFDIDIANIGNDITKTKEFIEADVIHLEWTNQGMLSIKNIQRIIESKKPVVWTMHDLWAATAICHYARGCSSFKTMCKQCKLLPHNGSDKDIAFKTWNKKKYAYSKGLIHFVCCSRWLENQAKQSALLREHKIATIPNPIDTRVFKTLNKDDIKKQLGLPLNKQILLFVSQKITNERKGVKYFIDAVKHLVDNNIELKKTVAVAFMGGNAKEVESQIPLQCFSLGYINNDEALVKAYNCADTFVIPSLEDNLPNTIMEAMACGIPCVGFNVGGIPEMIEHKSTGFVANFKDYKNLAEGIMWVLNNKNEVPLSQNSINKVLKQYSQQRVALRYIDVYNQAIARKIYNL